ncbi:hypothetical protein G6F57_001236 [Rhizopus arrhizus]|nr:hypothetical protein G6F24_001981 [Rhizopus arrhizus]KAG1413159.1 hypothetical protein G6F58_007644 [Rhizopus delemar]KAG0796645.1 hypothetical protein G6F22_004864 [Rhizopus arrhizus]KAG0877086.1 hypothetical protein G6F16_001864 [Rhizopus arrhizus]KAG0969517.1 hypothetical protein G6F31_001795 [Rhizopus arrhizus]
MSDRIERFDPKNIHKESNADLKQPLNLRDIQTPAQHTQDESNSYQDPITLIDDSEPTGISGRATRKKHHENRLSIKSIKSNESSWSVSTDNDVPSASTIEIKTTTDNPESIASICEFQLASEKRNNAFHALFRSVPQTDRLIEVYKCAIQKEILLQGHIYVSEHHICFKSNIFGWVTNLIINFNEIISVEKRMTAKLFPNGIMIDTHASRHIFASFLSRDRAYHQITTLWKLHKGELCPSSSFEDNRQESAYSSIYSSMHSSESATDLGKYSLFPVEEVSLEKSAVSHHSDPVDIPPVPDSRLKAISDSSNVDLESNVVNKYSTKTAMCPSIENNKKFSHVALDKVYPGTVEAFDKLFFEQDFIKCFLEQCEKFEDVEIENWKNNLRKITAKRKIETSLNHSLYFIESRICITRIDKQKVRIFITFEVSFKNAGLTSSVIEKNAADDQIRYYKHLESLMLAVRMHYAANSLQQLTVYLREMNSQDVGNELYQMNFIDAKIGSAR